MKVAVTGATGFIGKYLVEQLIQDRHEVKAWFRTEARKGGITHLPVEWLKGELDDETSSEELLADADAVIHAGLHRPTASWNVSGEQLFDWSQKNLMGSLRLLTTAKRVGVQRFIFVSTCAVHDHILDDRPLDEAHPLWPRTHYGAHKAAIEKFVHSFGFGEGYETCSVRPTGVYGKAHNASASKWFQLIQSVKQGKNVEVDRGGKEVHVADVARTLSTMATLPAEDIRGQSFNCYDQYISEHAVAHLAKELTGSSSIISGEAPQPKHQISTDKIRSLGITFGGDKLLRNTVEELLEVDM